MKKLLFIAACIAAISILISQCSSKNEARRDATTVGKHGWVFEGWSCAPPADRKKPPSVYCEKVDEKKHTYLYMKFPARASKKAMDEGSIAMKMSTCREAARLQVAGDGLAKIIGEYLEKASGVTDGMSTGLAIVSQTKGKIKGVGIYDCCSIDNDTGKCVEEGKKEEWENCMCVGYINFPGGRAGFETMAKEASGGG